MFSGHPFGLESYPRPITKTITVVHATCLHHFKTSLCTYVRYHLFGFMLRWILTQTRYWAVFLASAFLFVKIERKKTPMSLFKLSV